MIEGAEYVRKQIQDLQEDLRWSSEEGLSREDRIEIMNDLVLLKERYVAMTGREWNDPT